MIKTLVQVKNQGHETLYNSLKVSSFHSSMHRERLHGFMEKSSYTEDDEFPYFYLEFFQRGLDKFRKMHVADS